MLRVQGESLTFGRLWLLSAAMSYVILAYFKLSYERNLAQSMAQ